MGDTWPLGRALLRRQVLRAFPSARGLPGLSTWLPVAWSFRFWRLEFLPPNPSTVAPRDRSSVLHTVVSLTGVLQLHSPQGLRARASGSLQSSLSESPTLGAK